MANPKPKNQKPDTRKIKNERKSTEMFKIFSFGIKLRFRCTWSASAASRFFDLARIYLEL